MHLPLTPLVLPSLKNNLRGARRGLKALQMVRVTGNGCIDSLTRKMWFLAVWHHGLQRADTSRRWTQFWNPSKSFGLFAGFCSGAASFSLSPIR